MFFDSRLWIFTRGVRGRILASAAIGLLSSLFGVARLALLGWLLAMVFTGEPLSTLLPAAAAVTALILLRGGVEYWRIAMAYDTASRVQLHMRAQLYDKVLSLGPAYFGLTRSGDVITSLIEGVEHLEVYFGRYLPQLLVAVLTPLAIFAFVAFLDLPVALVFLGFAFLALLAPALFQQWDSRASLARSKDYRAYAAEFLDAVQGLATLKAFGQSGSRAKLLADKADRLFKSTMGVLMTSAMTRGITDCCIALGAALALALGIWRYEEGLLPLASLLVILMLGVEVFRPMRDLRELLHAGMLGRSASEGVLGLLKQSPSVTQEAGAVEPTAPLSPSIAFQDVRFSYPGGRGVALDDLSFDVAAGERVGIVGPSGSGKSSILKLLLRFYDPQAGVIRVGGQNIRDLSFEALRSQFAMVSQDTYLFHGTVEDNLRLGKPDATQEDLEAAARAANAHDFIRALPQGYRTVIGERGIRLSGGQRQRVAIARALLRDAPILILDEALSAVDAENEAVIQEALDRLMEGRTTLTLAHRLSSVIGSDRILVIEHGKVVEQGSHAALVAQGGVYSRLMAEQLEARTAEEADPMLPAALQTSPASESAVETTAAAEPEKSEIAEDAIVRAAGLGWGGVLKQLLSFIAPWKGRLTLTFLLGVARVVAFIGVGVLSALAVAGLKAGETVDGLLIALLLLAPTAGLLHWLESWIAHDMAFRLLADLRRQLFAKLDALAPAFLVRRRSGDLVAMATHDVEMVEYFFAHTVAPAFVAVLVPSAVIATLIVFDWRLAAALAPFLVLVAMMPVFLRRRIDRLAAKTREALGDLNAQAVDSVQGLTEILAFQQGGNKRAQFLDGVRKQQRLRLSFHRELSAQSALVEVATVFGGLAIVVTGALLVQQGAVDPALLPLFTLMAMASFLPISEIAEVGKQLADTLGATQRLYAVEHEPVPVTDGPLEAVPIGDGDVAGGVEIAFQDVGFTYPGQPRPALQNVSFAVPAGASVALVGSSGAGKTTIAQLLLRFWDPQQGGIDLAGHRLEAYRLDALRRCVALVAQDTYLFNDTLGANIRIARPEASEAELADAVRQAALEDFVDALPQGLDTPVGERGMALSGGQRQRVAIARAFLKDAPLLVLDEATSHLDALSERAVHGALSKLMQHRTTIVIAHRLSTVRDADCILVMDKGRVIEEGRHEELLARRGPYARLVGRQLAAGQQVSGDRAAE